MIKVFDGDRVHEYELKLAGTSLEGCLLAHVSDEVQRIWISTKWEVVLALQ